MTFRDLDAKAHADELKAVKAERSWRTINLYSRDGRVVGRSLVDIDSYAQFKDFVWRKSCGGYATRCVRPGGRKGRLLHVFLHREIVGLPPISDYANIVDHINRNKLDNRRSNLRIVSVSANIHNSGLRKDNSTGVRGLSWHARSKRWAARLQLRGKTIFSGWFKDKSAAVNGLRKARELFLDINKDSQ